MKLKKIIIVSKNDDVLYKLACHIYNIEGFPVKRINIINKNKAEICYKPFKIEMKRS